MTCQINNHSSCDTSEIEPLVQDLFQFANKRFGFKQAPAISFISDKDNHHILGKTGYYDPETMDIVIFADERHPKDMMRSIAHELVHHKQNEMGMFDRPTTAGAQYAQKDPHLRKMEAEAYLKGNMCFRDWEDGYKAQHKDIFYERRINKMSTKKWKNKELNGLLNERWGFSMDLGKLNEKIKNPGPYIDGERTKAGIDDDGDGEPNKVDPDPKDGNITSKNKSENKDKETDKPEDKKKENSDDEGKVLGVLEAEGGAAGMDALVKQTKLSKDEIRKIEKESDDIQKHRDGDYIDMTGLDLDEDKDEEDKNENHCNTEDQLREAVRKLIRSKLRK